jgi:hypothetical protein
VNSLKQKPLTGKVTVKGLAPEEKVGKMPDARLAGLRAKIGRAKKHAEGVDAAVKSFAGPDDYFTEIRDFRPDIGEVTVTARAPKPVDPELSVLIGDCVHNLRSALDYLVLQLAGLEGKSKDAETKTAFPICLNAESFKNATRKRIDEFISAAALVAIEEVQPYWNPDPTKQNVTLGERSILWLLSQLDIVDKHRTILVIAANLAVERLTITLTNGEIQKVECAPLLWRPWKDGEQILGLRFEKNPGQPRPAKITLETVSRIQLSETGLLCDEKGVQSTLTNCIRVVTHIVDDFGKRFFGE